MSLLDWELSATGVVVVTDTLSATIDGEPGGFCSKVVYVPHLSLLVGCTGFHDVLQGWLRQLLTVGGDREINDLNDRASACLPISYALVRQRARTTIRHWGWSDDEQRFVGYSFRSVDGFKAERMADGPALSPNPSPERLAQPIDSFEALAEVALDQQAFGLADSPPVYIGGHYLSFMLSLAEQGHVVCTTTRHKPFPGFEEHREAVERRWRPFRKASLRGAGLGFEPN